MLGVGGDVGYGGCEPRIEGIVQCTKRYCTILTLKALGIFFPDSRYWLSIFFRICTKLVLFNGAHCMSKSILGLKRTIPDHNRCHSHQKRRKPDQNR